MSLLLDVLLLSYSKSVIFIICFFPVANSICNARFAGIDHIEPEIQSYINANLAKSYDYLLLATHFNSYQKNRPGFQKLYQGLSDRSFEDSIALIKQVTRRGGIVDFNTRHESSGSVSTKRGTLEVDELHSLALALDTEKQLATEPLTCTPVPPTPPTPRGIPSWPTTSRRTSWASRPRACASCPAMPTTSPS